jgi:thioredoxin reductase (NADPH)
MSEPGNQDRLLVACLCATWCKTCTVFRETFDRLAASNRDVEFVWLDVEDDSALVGESDIENFPTLAVFRGNKPLFYGVTMPQEGVVARIEDNYAVTETGVENLTASLPREPADIEKLMAEGGIFKPRPGTK